MKVHKIKFIMLLTGGLIVSVLLVPGKQERALMFLKDWNYKQAQGLYEELLQKKAARRNNLVPLTQIYLGEGDIDLAIKLHEQYLKDYPQDIEVREMLANLYKDSQRLFDYIDATEWLVKENPSIEGYSHLLSLYEQSGLKDKKLRNVLKQLVLLDPDRKREAHELIKLQAAAGQLEQSIAGMQNYIDRFEDDISDATAEFYLRLLLSAKRTSQAMDWARHWSVNHKEVLPRFIALLYSGGLASSVASAFEEPVAVAPAVMTDWFVDRVISAGWESGNLISVERFYALLSQDIKAKYPADMAILAYRSADKDAFQYWLTKAEQTVDTQNDRQSRLMLMYFMSGDHRKALNLLSGVLQNPQRATALISQALPFILESDVIEESQSMFQAIVSNSTNPEIVAAWAVLTVALGKNAVITDWLKNSGKRISQGMLIELYRVAIGRAHYSLAGTVAERFFKLYESSDEILSITSGMLSKSKHSAADSHLIALLKSQMKRGLISRKLRRELAFLLLDKGMKQDAIAEFMVLANDEGPNGVNVKQLLYIWGPLPGDKGLDWLEMRASKAPAEQLAAWWKHMQQVGADSRIIMMAKQAGNNLPADAEAVLIDILTAKGDKSVVKMLLQQRAKTMTNPSSLEKLAMHANDAGLTEVEDMIWQRIKEQTPSHIRALKALGIISFKQGDMNKSEFYLRKYISRSGGDWESLFYLGDVMMTKESGTVARHYFKKSLDMIEADAWPEKRKRIAKAYLFYQLGRLTDATDLYEKLLRRYPGDIELKANYSAMLIEMGRLDKAHKILGKRR